MKYKTPCNFNVSCTNIDRFSEYNLEGTMTWTSGLSTDQSTAPYFYMVSSL